MSCGAPSTPELQLVHEAASTLGGTGEIEDVDMLRLTGDGESYWTGENPSPDANPPNFFSTFSRIYDWRDQRFRFEELQTPRFVTPNYDTKRFVTALDGNVAFNIDQYDKSSRQRDHLIRIRKGELLHHPVGVLQIALDPSTTLSGLRQRENYQVIDIETEEGIANIDKIASVKDVDCLWIGHFDLSCSLGINGQFEHPDFIKACDKVKRAANKHGKALARLAGSPADCIALYKKGYNVLCYSGDLWVYQQALNDGVNKIRASCKPRKSTKGTKKK